jgi:hypothetical protein
MCTSDGDACEFQKTDDTRGRAGCEYGIRSAGRKMTDVVRMEAGRLSARRRDTKGSGLLTHRRPFPD